MSLIRRVLQELKEIETESTKDHRKQYFSVVAMYELIKVYFKTTNDPGLNALVVRPAKQDGVVSTDTEDHQEWIGETINQEAADVLYYLISHWLKCYTKSEMTNHSAPDSATAEVNRLKDQSFLSICICWSLKHFVRRKAEVLPRPCFSNHLEAISAVLETTPEEAEIIVKEEIEDGVIKSCLSVYHYLSDSSTNCCLSCLHNAEWMKILQALNHLLLDLTKFTRIPKPFKGHLKPWSKVKGRGGNESSLVSYDQGQSILLSYLSCVDYVLFILPIFFFHELMFNERVDRSFINLYLWYFLYLMKNIVCKLQS